MSGRLNMLRGMERSGLSSVLLLTAILGITGVSVAAEEPALPPLQTGPLDWVYPAPEPLRAHVVRGLWSREYRIEEALARGGAGFVTESWHAQGMGFGWVGGWDPNGGGSVPEFPDTAEDLLANHVFVICNINAKAFTPSQQRLLQSFVQNGGGVLFLGGRFAFGSQWTNTPLAELAPVSFVTQGFDLTNVEKGLTMAAGPDRLGEKPATLHWEQAPRVFWYHDVKPKAGTQVTVVAEGHPLLISGTYGKGRVALFAGSVMGDPPAGSLAFWAWDDWPRLMAETVVWLSATRSKQNGVLGADVRAGLAKSLHGLDSLAEGGEAQKAFTPLEPQFWRAGKLCRDVQTAEMLVKAIASSGNADPPAPLAELLGRQIALALGKQGAAPAAELIASRLPGKTTMGLRLLGASHAEGAAATLARFLASGDVEKAEAVGTMNVDDMLVMAPAGQKEGVAVMIRLAALEGLVDCGDPKALPAIQAFIENHKAKGRIENLAGEQGVEAYTISDENRLYQTALVAALAAGDANAAAPLAEVLLGNVYVATRSRSGWNGPADTAKSVEGSLAYILAWESGVHELLRRCPEGRLDPLAPPLAAINDVRIVPAACAAFGGRALLPAVKAELRKSSVKGVACLGE